MLRDFKPKSFYEGSFADHRITKAEVDFDKKYFKLYIEGALSEDDDGNRLVFNDIEMEISNWHDFQIYKQILEPDKMVIVPPTELDMFTDIILFNLKESKLLLEGFGKETLAWYEYHFTNPKIVIKGELISP